MGLQQMCNAFYRNFSDRESDPECLAQYLSTYAEKAETLQEYVIAITPRSGSSWLTELLHSTELAGNPDEWFNPDEIGKALNFYGCATVHDYMKCIKGNQSTPNGVFGLQTTFFQFDLVLQGCSLDALFDEPHWIYLTRDDFVAQAISLYKATETGYFHSIQGEESYKNKIVYDAKKIKYWVLHILYQEYLWENFFQKHEISPLRLTYEELVQNVFDSLSRISRYLNLPFEKSRITQHTRHQKISNSITHLFQSQFNQDMRTFIEACERYRSKSEIFTLTADVDACS